ncbi:MAG: molybdenum cofactor biosynthesis protein B [Polyangiales bacterium]
MSPHPGDHPARVLTVTVSDTRAAADDRGGEALRACLHAQGYALAAHRIVRDELDEIAAVIDAAVDDDEVDAVVLTGGTGIAPRDVTYEAVAARLDKTLEGFGEAFRRVSWDEVGPRAILSRAVAGTRGRTVVVALPGSVGGVRTAVDRVLGPTLGHMVALLKGSRGA